MSDKKKLWLAGLGWAMMVLGVHSCSVLKTIQGGSEPTDYTPPPIPEPERIEPMGSPEAKVQVQFFFNSRNLCHEGTIELMKRIPAAVPRRIRVEFLDIATDEGFEASEKAALNCEAGLVINGQKEFEIERNGQKSKVPLLGPIGGPTGEGIPAEYARLALEQELKKQYGKGLTAEEWAKLNAVWKDLPQILQQGQEPAGASKGPGSMAPGPAGPGARGSGGEEPSA